MTIFPMCIYTAFDQTAPVVGLLMVLPLPIIKAKLSEQVDDTEQGKKAQHCISEGF